MVEDSLVMSALSACRSRLQAFIRGRTATRADADDILQDITVQLMKVEQPVENVAAWLFRAARNEMIDRGRKKRELPFSDFFASDDSLPEEELSEILFGEAETPEEAYLSELFWEELSDALAALPPAQYEAFVKTELYDYSVNALAQETGVSVQALLSRKHKAVRYLRLRLRALYEEIVAD
ncbi:RNA polymerase sigma factor [Erwinia oleae]|uniref:RNA polymerase sigma factor n=1 Tax=Erwinia oleae TaxID=796334 RepID=UPI00054EF197|nr:RNA polymerase sigma factor [Erwinia oleae]